MAKATDPNRWSPPDREAAEDDAMGARESRASSGVRWVLLIVNLLLALVVIALMA